MHSWANQISHQPQKGILIFHYHFFQFLIIDYILIDSSFFFTNKISEPYGKSLSLIKPLSNNFCNYFFNSCSLNRVIMYCVLDIGNVPRANFMLSFISFYSVKPKRLSRNAFGNSCIIRISFTSKTAYFSYWLYVPRIQLGLLCIVSKTVNHHVENLTLFKSELFTIVQTKTNFFFL